MLRNISSLSSLNFHLYRVTETIFPYEWKFDKTDRPYTIFWYVLSGEKRIIVGEKEFTVETGDLVIFPSNVPFTIFENENLQPLHLLDLAIESKIGPFDFFKIYKFPIVTKPENTKPIDHLITLWNQLKNVWSPTKLNPVHHHSNELNINIKDSVEKLRFSALINQWMAEFLILVTPYAVEKTMSIDQRLHTVLLYILDHLSEKISLKNLAQQVFLSESHFSLLFKQEMDISPIEYVRKIRLHKARELLLTTDYRIKEIAEMVGFFEQSQLSRAFREDLGISPLEYRQKGGSI